MDYTFITELLVTLKNLPIVFLHGWGARKDSFGRFGVDNVIVELAKYFYVVAPELPGLIRSQPPKTIWDMGDYVHLLHKLFRTLKLGKFILMGQSWVEEFRLIMRVYILMKLKL